jgi:hypothetical protein
LEGAIEFTLQTAHTLRLVPCNKPLVLELLRELSLLCPSLDGRMDLRLAMATLKGINESPDTAKLISAARHFAATPPRIVALPNCWSILPKLLSKCLKNNKVRWAQGRNKFVQHVRNLRVRFIFLTNSGSTWCDPAVACFEKKHFAFVVYSCADD